MIPQIPVRFRKWDSAFTLIELLIVIAIILILIAIALPNFLEAQTRSRVTRAKAEMRGLGLALEAYRTDYRRYPPNAFYEQTPFNVLPTPVNIFGLMMLTTPVKYMDRVPTDPFAPTDGKLVNGTTGGIIVVLPPDKLHGMSYLYWSQDSLRKDGQITTVDAMKRNGINWSLQSVAPDGDLDSINLNPNDMVALRINATNWAYSPTNGTKSNGDIARVVP